MLLHRYILVCLLLVSKWGIGQNNPFAFHHLTEKNGLSNGIVNCFLKDSRGLLWVGTYEGLNRFDGTHFYTFQKTKSPTSIFNNVVHSLCEDQLNNIWGATESGIVRYDPKANTFKHYESPNSKNSIVSLNIARAVQNILCDKNGNIWATGVWTILKYNPSKDAFEEIGPLTTNYDSLTSYSVRKNGLIEDPSGKGLWLATRMGIHYYDFASNKFSSFKNDSNPLFARRNVAALSVSPSGQCWFYDNSHGKIIGFDPATKKATHEIDMMKAMPDAVGATIFEDSESRLWFSSWNAGPAIVDYKRNTITRFQNEINDPTSISNNFFWAVREDEDGTVWLGTGSGISICNSSKSIYRIHRFSEKFPFLKYNSIRTIVEDPVDKSWWLVTRNKLFVIHHFPTTGRNIIYDLEKGVKNANGSLPGPVYNIHFIKNKPVLTTHFGAWEIDTLKNTILPFNPSPEVDPKFVVRALIEHRGNYYMSDAYTLLRCNSVSGKVDSIKYTFEKFRDGQRPVFSQMYLGPDNKVWFISAFGWMSYLDENDKIVSQYLLKNEKVEMSGYFTSWSFDGKGNVWLASVGVGLYQFRPASKEVRYWDQTDGLVNNKITTAVSDRNGLIWAAAGNKFSVFKPGEQTFYNFILPFAANEIDYDNGQALLSNGSIAVTVKNDVIEFIPSRLDLTPHVRVPLIGSVNIAGRQQFLVKENELYLEPDEKSLSLKFGMLTDVEVFPYYFEYMLDGLDDKWVESGPENQAIYNKLPSGNYTFRLRAKARNGSWKSPETILRIHIKTPFLRSAWFYTLAIIFSCALIILFYRFRTRKQRQLVELTSKAQMLEKEKALVMYENLKQHLNPHFLFNSLTSLGSLIRINQAMAGDFLDKMSKVYRYILKNRDNEVVPLGEELKFVQLYIDLHKTRFEEGLDVNVNVDEEHYHRKIAPVTLQNLVENAIKHNTSEPNSPLRISLYVMDDYMIVRNNLQRKSFVETSNKQGLSNMESLYHYLSNRPMLIIEDEQYFTVKIPLL